MGLKNSNFKHRNLFQAAKSAIFGILFAFKKERNLRIDLVVFTVLWLIIYIMKFSLAEILICCLNWVLVVSLEIVNTVFERLIDKIWGTEYNEDVKHLKDMAAAAVFVLSAVLVVNVGVISLSKIFR